MTTMIILSNIQMSIEQTIYRVENQSTNIYSNFMTKQSVEAASVNQQ